MVKSYNKRDMDNLVNTVIVDCNFPGTIYLANYSHSELDESFLWSLSPNVGYGYRCLSPLNSIHVNMDAKQTDSEADGIYDGNDLILLS
ncbi:hypothetical protein SUGI_0070980 [Cryptomeria japonica]|uniref:ricin B-like lectin R40G3 n=1 Tax=Cryptomeria japonica TaxID=3369 RepID=UPI002408BCFB|nr:ricin B-like lectin R40G3 [Cryptomeria japonica]GLJ07617.1 hypothetical protein SUGI_0070980 [Cryptomeria japonica]